jgi:hypothetical protein
MGGVPVRNGEKLGRGHLLGLGRKGRPDLSPLFFVLSFYFSDFLFVS